MRSPFSAVPAKKLKSRMGAGASEDVSWRIVKSERQYSSCELRCFKDRSCHKSTNVNLSP